MSVNKEIKAIDTLLLEGCNAVLVKPIKKLTGGTHSINVPYNWHERKVKFRIVQNGYEKEVTSMNGKAPVHIHSYREEGYEDDLGGKIAWVWLPEIMGEDWSPPMNEDWMNFKLP